MIAASTSRRTGGTNLTSQHQPAARGLNQGVPTPHPSVHPSIWTHHLMQNKQTIACSCRQHHSFVIISGDTYRRNYQESYCYEFVFCKDVPIDDYKKKEKRSVFVRCALKKKKKTDGKKIPPKIHVCFSSFMYSSVRGVCVLLKVSYWQCDVNLQTQAKQKNNPPDLQCDSMGGFCVVKTVYWTFRCVYPAHIL